MKNKFTRLRRTKYHMLSLGGGGKRSFPPSLKMQINAATIREIWVCVGLWQYGNDGSVFEYVYMYCVPAGKLC